MKLLQKKTLLYTSAILLVVVSCMFFVLQMIHLFKSSPNPSPFPKTIAIDFNDCKKRGYVVTQGYPETCTTPEGVTFIDLYAYLKVTHVVTQKTKTGTLEASSSLYKK